MRACTKISTAYDENRLRRRRRQKLTLQQRYDNVINMCSGYLARKLTVNNCIDMILFAKKHRMYRLLQLSAAFIDHNFEMVFTSDEFIELEPEHLFKLLPMLIYNEMTEDIMRNAIMFWFKYKKAERKKYIDVLMK